MNENYDQLVARLTRGDDLLTIVGAAVGMGALKVRWAKQPYQGIDPTHILTAAPEGNLEALTESGYATLSDEATRVVVAKILVDLAVPGKPNVQNAALVSVAAHMNVDTHADTLVTRGKSLTSLIGGDAQLVAIVDEKAASQKQANQAITERTERLENYLKAQGRPYWVTLEGTRELVWPGEYDKVPADVELEILLLLPGTFFVGQKHLADALAEVTRSQRYRGLVPMGVVARYLAATGFTSIDQIPLVDGPITGNAWQAHKEQALKSAGLA